MTKSLKRGGCAAVTGTRALGHDSSNVEYPEPIGASLGALQFAFTFYADSNGRGTRSIETAEPERLTPRLFRYNQRICLPFANFTAALSVHARRERSSLLPRDLRTTSVPAQHGFDSETGPPNRDQMLLQPKGRHRSIGRQDGPGSKSTHCRSRVE